MLEREISRIWACRVSEIGPSVSNKATRASWSKRDNLFFKPLQLGISLADDLIQACNLCVCVSVLLLPLVRESIFQDLLGKCLPCADLGLVYAMLRTDFGER